MDKLIELHLHLDGSLSVRRRSGSWQRNRISSFRQTRVDEVRDQMQVPEDCRTLEEYLTRFDLPLLVLQTREQSSAA